MHPQHFYVQYGKQNIHLFTMKGIGQGHRNSMFTIGHLGFSLELLMKRENVQCCNENPLILYRPMPHKMHHIVFTVEWPMMCLCIQCSKASQPTFKILIESFQSSKTVCYAHHSLLLVKRKRFKESGFSPYMVIEKLSKHMGTFKGLAMFSYKN